MPGRWDNNGSGVCFNAHLSMPFSANQQGMPIIKYLVRVSNNWT